MGLGVRDSGDVYAGVITIPKRIHIELTARTALMVRCGLRYRSRALERVMTTTISRNEFLKAAGLGAASLALPRKLAAAETSDGGAQRPNILFIFTDDHASHAIGAYGSKINQTPNLDRIANEGMRFDNCFCTNSICAPSRAVILTGKHNHLNGMTTNATTFDGSQQTFPKLLQKAGYQTAMLGKWHLKSDPTGFDFWNVLIGQGPYYNPPLKTPEGTVKHTGYTTDILTDIALDWMENKRDKTKPFVMMYQHKAPHRNWQPDPKHLHMYDDVTIPEPATLFDDYANRTSAAHLQEMAVATDLTADDLKLVPPGNLTPEQLDVWMKAYGPKNRAFINAGLEGDELIRWKYQRYLKDYLRCIASVDDNVGRVLDYLDETGLADNTIVVYSSDQGFYLGDHGWFDKRWMYEESLRMPLLVRWPGVTEPGSTNGDLVQNLDFAETFLDIAGVEIPSDMQGESLVPLLGGETPENWRKSIYYHYHEFPGWHAVRRHYGVRTDRYKLIYYYGIDEWELFDLKEDPDELASRYGDPNYAGVVRELKTELTRLREYYQFDKYVEDPTPPDPKRVERELVLHYDFGEVDGAEVRDLSGGGNHGIIRNARLTAGRKGKALLLDGAGTVELAPIPPALDPTCRPLTIGAWCKADSPDGTLMAFGTRSFGFALSLSGGKPVFTVRANVAPHRAAASRAVPLGEWVHLAGVIDTDGRLHVLVNGEDAGQSERTRFFSHFLRNPGNLTVGEDPNSQITGAVHHQFHGQIEDIRLYWSRPDEAAMKQWTS